MAKVMAYVEDGVVTNIVSYNEDEPETSNLKDIFDRPVWLGDLYSRGHFYRGKNEVLSPLEERYSSIGIFVEQDLKATNNYSPGDYLAIGYDLFQVIDSIPKHCSIVLGQNVYKATIDDYLAKLKGE